MSYREIMNNTWKENALFTFLEIVNSSEFPCLFAKKSIQNKSYIPFFYSAEDEKNSLLEKFLEYTESTKNIAIKERIYSPLILFINNNLLKNGQSQHELAWELLNWLHRNDIPSSWPSNIPKDPDLPSWSFCFNGVQLFINISCSDHKILKSRNLGKHLVLVVNPRENFDFVAGEEKGRKIREKIRKRISIYNNGYIPSELGFFGDGSKEWLQYQLQEEGLPRPNKCPFKYVEESKEY